MSDRPAPKLKPTFKSWLDRAASNAEQGHTISFKGDYAASLAFLTRMEAHEQAIADGRLIKISGLSPEDLYRAMWGKSDDT